MNLVILSLGTIFVWVTGVLYLKHVRDFVRMRTDRVTFVLFPFAKTVELKGGGIWRAIVRGIHGFSALLYVVVGVPIALFFMGLMPLMLARQLMQG